MITLTKLAIYGVSEGGEFSGEIIFNNRINIIDAENGFGKSMIYTGIVWCLGLEQSISMVNDTSIWTDGAIDKVELFEGTRYDVINSFAILEFVTSDSRSISLKRNIKGGGVDVVECAIINSDQSIEQMTLYTSKHNTFSNPNISLMRQLFIWANLDMKKLYTQRGESSLYLENLAPLFFIYQMGGWNDLFADQVRRYGLIEIDEIAVEYVIGVKKRLDHRINRIKFNLDLAEHRRRIIDVLERINEVISLFSDDKLPYRSNDIQSLITSYSNFSLRMLLSTKYNFRFERDREILIIKQKNIESLLDLKEEHNSEISENVDLSVKRNEILVLKNSLRENSIELDKLKLRILDDAYALEDSMSKVQLYKDLEIMKRAGVGLFSREYRCPTCTQDVNPKKFNIVNLSEDEVVLSVKIKRTELAALKLSKEENERKLILAEKTHARLEQEIQELESLFEFLNVGFSTKKVKVFEYATEFDHLKTELRKLNELNDKITELDKEILTVVGAVATELNKVEFEEERYEQRIISDLGKEFRVLIKSLKLTAFKNVTNIDESLKDVTVLPENDYIPFYKNKPLKRYCSASDQSKIIFAYLIAIQKVAIGSTSGSHFGFCIFDEPIQQNPENDYKQSTINFLGNLRQFTAGQIIIFTKLDKIDVSKISDGLIEVKGKRFLQKV